MDAFKELRRQAAEKRDKAIKVARDEYNNAADKIRELERQLIENAIERPKRRAITDIILDVVPQDDTWTMKDLMRWLEATEPERRFSAPFVRSLVNNLVKKGTLQRVRKGPKGRVIYALAGVEADPGVFGDQKLIDICRQMIEEHGELSATDLVVRLQESGYPVDDPHRLRNTVRAMLPVG